MLRHNFSCTWIVTLLLKFVYKITLNQAKNRQNQRRWSQRRKITARRYRIISDVSFLQKRSKNLYQKSCNLIILHPTQFMTSGSQYNFTITFNNLLFRSCPARVFDLFIWICSESLVFICNSKWTSLFRYFLCGLICMWSD